MFALGRGKLGWFFEKFFEKIFTTVKVPSSFQNHYFVLRKLTAELPSLFNTL